MQQRGVHHAVDCGGGSHSERHGGDRDEREAGRPAQHPRGVLQIEKQILDERQALLGVMVFADGFGCAELEHGLAARLGRSHAGAQILFGLEGEVFGELFLQAPVGAARGGEIRKANEKASQKFHDRSSAFTLKKRAMMAAVCSQSLVSVCSCFRPAAVMR